MASSSFNNSEGCLFLAAIFTSVLWGVGIVQVYHYYESHSSRDTAWLKIYVFIAWVLDTVHEALLLKSVYTYLVSDIGDMPALEHSSKDLALTTIFNALVDAQVQLFFTWRIWKLSEKNKFLVGSFLIFILMQFIATSIFFTELYASGRFANAGNLDLARSLKLAMAASAFVHTTLALALVFLLHHKQCQTSFRMTSTVIGRIMKYSVGTSLITAAFAIGGLVILFTTSGNLYFLTIAEMFPAVYLNCMLFSLTSRPSQRECQKAYALGGKGMTVPSPALTSISTASSVDSDTGNVDVKVNRGLASQLESAIMRKTGDDTPGSRICPSTGQSEWE